MEINIPYAIGLLLVVPVTMWLLSGNRDARPRCTYIPKMWSMSPEQKRAYTRMRADYGQGPYADALIALNMGWHYPSGENSHLDFVPNGPTVSQSYFGKTRIEPSRQPRRIRSVREERRERA